MCYQSGGSFSIDKGSPKSGLKTWTTYGQLVSFLIDFDNKTVNAWVDGVDVGYTLDITSYLSDTAPIWYPAISVGDWSSLTNDEKKQIEGMKKIQDSATNIYDKYVDKDGFLYITYASENTFG